MLGAWDYTGQFDSTAVNEAFFAERNATGSFGEDLKQWHNQEGLGVKPLLVVRPKFV